MELDFQTQACLASPYQAMPYLSPRGAPVPGFSLKLSYARPSSSSDWLSREGSHERGWLEEVTGTADGILALTCRLSFLPRLHFLQNTDATWAASAWGPGQEGFSTATCRK